MSIVELSLGSIEYEEQGSGPTVLLLHGLLQSNRVWRDVIADLAADHRVIAPTLPYGSHTIPLRRGAEVTPRTVALLIGELADALDLPDDTVFVENDAGRLQQLAAARPERIGRMVIAGCEAFDNYPPGAPGKLLHNAARIPGGIYALALALTPRPLRSIPGTGFTVMTNKTVPHDLTDEFLRPLRTDPRVRADLVTYLRGTRKEEMLEAAEALAGFEGPTLIIWGAQDRLMPPSHGRRLAELLPQAKHMELEDCGTLVSLDQPKAFAAALRNFAQATV